MVSVNANNAAKSNEQFSQLGSEPVDSFKKPKLRGRREIARHFEHLLKKMWVPDLLADGSWFAPPFSGLILWHRMDRTSCFCRPMRIRGPRRSIPRKRHAVFDEID